MSDQSIPVAEELTAVLMYVEAPKNIGEVLEPITDDKLDIPLPQISLPVNGRNVLVGLVDEKLDPEGAVGFAVSMSPVRSYVEPVLNGHQAYALVTMPVDGDICDAYATLTALVGGLAQHDAAKAVYLPSQDAVTTDVLFAGEGEQRSSQNWFRVHAMKVDENTSVAFTRGLNDFGGLDVQLMAQGVQPSALFGALREAVCNVVETGRPPSADQPITIAGALHHATEVEGVVGGRMLDLRPA